MSVRRPLPTFSPFTFGTAALGGRVADFDRDVRVARAAMEAGVWFHTSQEYGAGGAFMVLRHAFDAARSDVPPMIFKVRCDRAETIRFDVDDACRRVSEEVRQHFREACGLGSDPEGVTGCSHGWSEA